MTVFPLWLHSLIIDFWAKGTLSGFISTPRSPLAIMMHSTASKILSKLSRPSKFSILAMIAPLKPSASDFKSFTSWTLLVKERAIYSTSYSFANFIISKSSLKRGGTESCLLGILTPLPSSISPSFSTNKRSILLFFSTTRVLILPLSM